MKKGNTKYLAIFFSSLVCRVFPESLPPFLPRRKIRWSGNWSTFSRLDRHQGVYIVSLIKASISTLNTFPKLFDKIIFFFHRPSIFRAFCIFPFFSFFNFPPSFLPYYLIFLRNLPILLKSFPTGYKELYTPLASCLLPLASCLFWIKTGSSYNKCAIRTCIAQL